MAEAERPRIGDEGDVDGCVGVGGYFLQKFRLYETRSNFYMVGRDKNKEFWRVLKIDRLESAELNILEDPTIYTEFECCDLLTRIHEGNKPTGGLKLVTACYGIIGFIRFLGPYYMLIITKRRKIGTICGHAVYSITKREMIQIPNTHAKSNMDFIKNESRYKKLLCSVDLTKDFFFSYSYHVMRCLQKNLCDNEPGQILYETMFVWNEYLTRGIRNSLKNALWTVALVHGFFKQVTLSAMEREFKLTLIARRSRHFAGTRYLKRGVNEKGRVANDVETEQIVFEDAPEGSPSYVTSVVQHRGSIPLFWSQETSKLNIRPDIIVSRKDPKYEATRLHFENLVKRYGNPIIVLNLIKTWEKKPRETILRAEFANAIRFINRSLPQESRLRFLHWDINKHAKGKENSALIVLYKVAEYALNLTGIFHSQVATNMKSEGSLVTFYFEKSDSGDSGSMNNNSDDADSFETDVSSSSSYSKWKMPLFQKGVLRTNCIDCLDRTNVAQYAYGLVALGKQLHVLGLRESEDIDFDDPLAVDLMDVYEAMGDTLAMQYGGSPAHNKIFSASRGQWNAATQSQEFFRTLQRYYSNAYIDAVKQDAINVFLGYFQPQQEKPALWELNSDQHPDVGKRCQRQSSSFFKRSLSDGNILLQADTPSASKILGRQSLASEENGGFCGCQSESIRDVSASESKVFDSRQRVHFAKDHGFVEGDHISDDEERGDGINSSNFLDIDWLSSGGSSFIDDNHGRSSSSMSSVLLDNNSNNKAQRENDALVGCKSSMDEFSEDFIRWVTEGEVLFS
ncbi:hypothetical protein MLD38_030783 [Melastoma candidum]|uniref:Uncharacterized protein n=1 Tax=Melastoma candidum TaxID=119954 RepID=A0ACB9MM68_9MYRT|nr:hypothetical protein MLD38_030783 [Melastoma candidum]